MQTMLKSLFILIFGVTLLTSCEESILEDGDGSLSQNNVHLRVTPYWNNNFFKTDSIYFVNGAYVQIDQVSVLHANMTFVNDGDTIEPGDMVLWKTGQGNVIELVNLPVGSYSGFYFYNVGLDSLQDALPPQFYPGDSPLVTEGLYRGSQLGGYNYIVVKGKIVDPAKPLEGPTIPLNWVVATQPLVSTFGQSKSFNVVEGRNITLDAVFNIARLFDGIAPLTVPIILADPQDLNDYNQALTLQQNFVNAYNLQL